MKHILLILTAFVKDFRYALSQDISVAIVGCSSSEEVNTLADTGRDLKPLSSEESAQLLKVFELYARQLAYY